jgi:hypothetical protein
MKSFICEETNIEKAVNKAFLMAGKPEFFLVKILDIGKSSIFFWKKRKCKIAFSYSFDSSQSDLSIYENEKNKKRELHKNNFNRFDQQRSFDSNKNNFRDSSDNSLRKKNYFFENKRTLNNKPENNEQEKNNFSKNYKNRNLNFNSISKNKQPDIDLNNLDLSISWKKEYISFVENWILWVSESFNLSSSRPKINIDKVTLTIFMGAAVFENSIKEKHLCSSLVVLLYEILKRKFNDFDSRVLKIVINYSNN